MKMNNTLWPSPRARNIAIAMENQGRITKPAGVTRWSHDTAIDSLAEYGRISRETLLATHPVDYIVLNMYNTSSILRLLPKEVVYSYRGPYRNTHAYLFNRYAYGY
jgi:hypothetical protein